MPKHVHLILRPADADALGHALGSVHRRGVNYANVRGRWRANPVHGCFVSVAMDKAHLLAAKSSEAQPGVRATGVMGAGLALVERKRESERRKRLVPVQPVLDRLECCAALNAPALDECGVVELRAAEMTGSTLGAVDFVADLE